MCRATAAGGRRCPGCRGERRREYQRLRYARLKADTTPQPTASPAPAPGEVLIAELRRGQAVTAAALDTAITQLRRRTRGTDSDVEAAYTAAVLAHGAVLRDIATARIAAAYRTHAVDDDACDAEAQAMRAEAEANRS